MDSQTSPAVPEPGARFQPGRRGSAGIANRPLLPVQDRGVRVAERATSWEREGHGQRVDMQCGDTDVTAYSSDGPAAASPLNLH